MKKVESVDTATEKKTENDRSRGSFDRLGMKGCLNSAAKSERRDGGESRLIDCSLTFTWVVDNKRRRRRRRKSKHH